MVPARLVESAMLLHEKQWRIVDFFGVKSFSLSTSSGWRHYNYSNKRAGKTDWWSFKEVYWRSFTIKVSCMTGEQKINVNKNKLLACEQAPKWSKVKKKIDERSELSVACVRKDGRGPVDWPVLMPPVHDTRFWYHGLIGQITHCWQVIDEQWIPAKDTNMHMNVSGADAFKCKKKNIIIWQV